MPEFYASVVYLNNLTSITAATLSAGCSDCTQAFARVVAQYPNQLAGAISLTGMHMLVHLELVRSMCNLEAP